MEKNMEIERKFWTTKNLIHSVLELQKGILPSETLVISQTYLVMGKENEERVRSSHCIETGITTYTFTKKIGFGVSREEIEREIPQSEYNAHLPIGMGTIDKTRLVYLIDNYKIEVDYYLNGVVSFEIEFTSEKEAYKVFPDYLNAINIFEITGDKKFSNFRYATEAPTLESLQKEIELKINTFNKL